MANATAVTTENFDQEVLQSNVPVLVDFWAEWCMPCRMIAPALEELATGNAGKLKVVKVNVDEQGDLAMKYSITSIPSLLLFKQGSVVKQQVGAAPKAALEALVKPFL